MRFLGNSEAKTDAKGRVFLPAVFRKQLQAASQECLILPKTPTKIVWFFTPKMCGTNK